MLIYGLPIVALVLTFGGCQREDPLSRRSIPPLPPKGRMSETFPLPRAINRWMYK